MNTNWRDVLLGVLMTYVIIDMMLAYTMKQKYPSCFEKMVESINDRSGIVIILIGILLGIVVWYLTSRSKECFLSSHINKTSENDY